MSTFFQTQSNPIQSMDGSSPCPTLLYCIIHYAILHAVKINNSNNNNITKKSEVICEKCCAVIGWRSAATDLLEACLRQIRYMEFDTFEARSKIKERRLRDSNIRNLGTIDSLAKHTPHHVANRVTADFQWFCDLAIIFWADACATSMHSLL